MSLLLIAFYFYSCTSSENTLGCLREVDVNVLAIVNEKINVAGFFGTFTFVPVVDGTFIRQRPTQSLKEGKVNGVGLESTFFCRAPSDHCLRGYLECFACYSQHKRRSFLRESNRPAIECYRVCCRTLPEADTGRCWKYSGALCWPRFGTGSGESHHGRRCVPLATYAKYPTQLVPKKLSSFVLHTSLWMRSAIEHIRSLSRSCSESIISD